MSRLEYLPLGLIRVGAVDQALVELRESMRYGGNCSIDASRVRCYTRADQRRG